MVAVALFLKILTESSVVETNLLIDNFTFHHEATKVSDD